MYQAAMDTIPHCRNVAISMSMERPSKALPAEVIPL